MAPSPFSAAIFTCPPVRDSRIAIVPDATNNRAAATPSARSPPAVFRTSIISRVAPDLVSDAICERSCSPVRRPKEATRTYPMPGPCCRLFTSTVCGASRVSSTMWGSVVLPPRMIVSLTFEPAAPARRRCPSTADMSRVGRESTRRTKSPGRMPALAAGESSRVATTRR